MKFKDKLADLDRDYHLGYCTRAEWRRELAAIVATYPCDHCGQVGHREELHREKLKEAS